MDENRVSFQMFLIPLSLIVVGSESQISVDQMTLYSSKVQGILGCLKYFFWEGGGHAQKSFFSVKKTAYGTLLGSISSVFLLAFILKYYPILHVLKI